MARIQFDICKTDSGQSYLLKDPSNFSSLWADERETILARIGTTKGLPEIGLVIYAVSYDSAKEWIVRRIELINSLDARSRSNITITLKIPAQFNHKGQQLLDIFDAINNDVKNHLSSPSADLLAKLECKGFDSTWHSGIKNGKHGVKTFANQEELVSLLNNLLQPQYQEYQEVYFIPQDCKFYEDNHYTLLTKGVDMLTTKTFEPQEPIAGVVFKPERSSMTIFTSQATQTRVKWLCDGYKTIEKPFGDSSILPHEVYQKVNTRNLFSVTPSNATITCYVDGIKTIGEGEFVYIPYKKNDRCEFEISCDGYEKKRCKWPEIRQTVTLTENARTSTLKLYASDGEYAVKATFYPSSLGKRDVNSLVLCTKNYLANLQPQEDKTFSRSFAIIMMVITLIVGGGIGYLSCRLTQKPKEITPEGENPGHVQPTDSIVHLVTDDPQELTDDEKLENYLTQGTWFTGGEDDNLPKLNGLYNALNTYDYKNIVRIYNTLGNIPKGKLERVYQTIMNHGGFDQCKKPRVNFNPGNQTKEITIATWIQKVEAANTPVDKSETREARKQQSSGGGAGGGQTNQNQTSTNNANQQTADSGIPKD